jgi:putative nucleotidyltransferase with HDIG domain
MSAGEYRTSMGRAEAISLLRRHVHEDSLLKHCYATGAVMKALAGSFMGNPEVWEEIGILHDIDYEQVSGDMQQHGIIAAEVLKTAGFQEDFAQIVMRHNHLLFTGTYLRPVEISLQAADSASGLIMACALVKGGRLSDVSVKTILKKIKERSFAAGCDRECIALIEPIMKIPEFYQHALDGMMEIRQDLGLR